MRPDCNLQIFSLDDDGAKLKKKKKNQKQEGDSVGKNGWTDNMSSVMAYIKERKDKKITMRKGRQ